LSGAKAIPRTLVVQSWRSIHFHTDDPDPTLILTFVSEGNAGRIHPV